MVFVVVVVAVIVDSFFFNHFKLERLFSQIQINHHAGGVPVHRDRKEKLVPESVQLSPHLCVCPVGPAASDLLLVTLGRWWLGLSVG